MRRLKSPIHKSQQGADRSSIDWLVESIWKESNPTSIPSPCRASSLQNFQVGTLGTLFTTVEVVQASRSGQQRATAKPKPIGAAGPADYHRRLGLSQPDLPPP